MWEGGTQILLILRGKGHPDFANPWRRAPRFCRPKLKTLHPPVMFSEWSLTKMWLSSCPVLSRQIHPAKQLLVSATPSLPFWPYHELSSQYNYALHMREQYILQPTESSTRIGNSSPRGKEQQSGVGTLELLVVCYQQSYAFITCAYVVIHSCLLYQNKYHHVVE